jgi:protein involved in polysaccharide export with SLBB domain
MHLSDLLPDKEALLTRDYWKERNALSAPERFDRNRYSSNDSRQTETARLDLPGGTNDGTNELSNIDRRTAEPLYASVDDKSLGASMSPENRPTVRAFRPHNLVQPAAPDINWEYAVIERIDKTTLANQLIPFNLGKLVLQHDRSQDLILQPGDVVTIFSTSDFSVPIGQQTKQVRLEGEVAMAGVYTVAPGETLRQVVARAGGFTPSAYLYGAQFTREATRREQQKRYNDYLDQFEREVNEAASNLSSRVTSVQQVATAQTSLTGQHELIDRLRKASMNGRVVLGVDPNSRGVESLPDLPLENGDRLYVPSRPSTINVIGTVYEQAAFLYEDDLRSGDYLKKAGGPTRAADKSHMFIIRADGSVVSHSTDSSFFTNRFDSLKMYAGDTLIVPTYINKSSFTRNFIDWSQIFSNLGFGVAAVNVLR